MQRGPPVSSLITSRYFWDSLGCLVAETPVIYICLYILTYVSLGAMHSRFPDVSEACRAHYTPGRNVAGDILHLHCHIWQIIAYIMVITIELLQ
jgi:hypothetical protein